MAMRSLATRMGTPAAAALRRRPVPGMPPPARSQFLGDIPSQNGNAIRRFSFDTEHARDTLRQSKEQDEAMRRGIKRYGRVVRAMKFTCYLGITASIVGIVKKAGLA